MPAVFAHCCQALGWTWDYVEENLDVPRLAALTDYWREHPPTHVLLAWRYEFKPQAKPTEAVNTDADISQLMQAFGGIK